MEKKKVRVSLDYEVIREPRYNSFLGKTQNPVIKRQFKLYVMNPTGEISKAVLRSFVDFMRKNDVDASIENHHAVVTILFSKEKEKIKDLYQAWRHYDLFLVLEQAR